MTTGALILRWIHIVAGGAWLGAVVMVVFVLVPSINQLGEPRRGWFTDAVFPKVFRLASVLSVTVVITGLASYLERVGWQLELRPLTSGRWGWSILIGGLLALLLTVFHFVAEGRLAPHIRGTGSAPMSPRGLTVLRIAPRVGLAILLTVVFLMTYAVHGT
ncbi:MAG: DUF4149 domain-containing protein [Acidimicrobiia bacterium]